MYNMNREQCTHGVGTTGSTGPDDPHFLEHGVERGQGHRISDDWIL